MPALKSSDQLTLPAIAQLLAQAGPETATSVQTLARESLPQQLGIPVPGASQVDQDRIPMFQMLVEAFREGWTDKPISVVLDHLASELRKGREPELSALSRWIRAHPGDPDAVIACIDVRAPEEIRVIRLLSRAGSQKLVFLANWQIAQREVVLKKILATASAPNILARELQPHPLSMAHDNIIETHLVRNQAGESFLVERKLPVVLSDSWRSNGVDEAANLLRGIASALAFLHEKGLVHGDVKPDNIGYEEERYILLDFGICRTAEAFAETNATGSLRTRAPELILGEKNHSPQSDVWALAATVYNAVCGRFPLFKPDEAPPRVSHPDERQGFQKVLEDRVKSQFDTFVRIDDAPEPLRKVFSLALAKDPGVRPQAGELVRMAEEELAAFLRGATNLPGFSPVEELRQLRRHLPQREVVQMMPESRKHELKEVLDRLRIARGLTAEDLGEIERISGMLV